MSPQELGLLAIRWIHVLAAVVAIGGLLFMRLILLPAAQETLDEEQHQRLRDAVVARWKKLVNACIGLLLLSGIGNFIWVGIPKAKEVGAQYHVIFGLKFMAAFGVFFLASALVGKSPALEGIRRQRARWMWITALLGMAAILMGGYLGRLQPAG